MGVYNRFGGKDGLVDALLSRGFSGLRDAIAPHGETDPVQRLAECGRRYREFALAHPAHYVAMFDDAYPTRSRTSPAVERLARATFDELVGHVQYGMVGGVLAAGDPTRIAQQIWSCVHGAVQLEIKGMLQVPDAQQAYSELIATLFRGLQVLYS